MKGTIGIVLKIYAKIRVTHGVLLSPKLLNKQGLSRVPFLGTSFTNFGV